MNKMLLCATLLLTMTAQCRGMHNGMIMGPPPLETTFYANPDDQADLGDSDSGEYGCGREKDDYVVRNPLGECAEIENTKIDSCELPKYEDFETIEELPEKPGSGLAAYDAYLAQLKKAISGRESLPYHYFVKEVGAFDLPKVTQEEDCKAAKKRLQKLKVKETIKALVAKCVIPDKRIDEMQVSDKKAVLKSAKLLEELAEPQSKKDQRRLRISAYKNPVIASSGKARPQNVREYEDWVKELEKEQAVLAKMEDTDQEKAKAVDSLKRLLQSSTERHAFLRTKEAEAKRKEQEAKNSGGFFSTVREFFGFSSSSSSGDEKADGIRDLA